MRTAPGVPVSKLRPVLRRRFVCCCPCWAFQLPDRKWVGTTGRQQQGRLVERTLFVVHRHGRFPFPARKARHGKYRTIRAPACRRSVRGEYSFGSRCLRMRLTEVCRCPFFTICKLQSVSCLQYRLFLFLLLLVFSLCFLPTTACAIAKIWSRSTHLCVWHNVLWWMLVVCFRQDKNYRRADARMLPFALFERLECSQRQLLNPFGTHQASVDT